MARTSNLANVATVTRASKAWDPLWDFTSGGAVGTLTEYASGVARYGADGLLVEEACTNQIRNPRGEGATGSTEPTNWSIPAAWDAIATWTTGTEDGWPYAQAVFNGTPSGDCTLSLESATQIGAADGEDWTISAGLKLVAGTLTNIDDIAIRHHECTSGGSTVVTEDGADIKSSIDAIHRRFFAVHELDGGGTVAKLQPQIILGYTSGAVNFTIRIYAPQCEEKAYPTSPILPDVASPAASTRAADQIGIADGAWAGASAGTWFADVQFIQPQGLGLTRFFVGGSTSSRWLYYSGQGVSFFDGTTAVAAPNTETQLAGDTLKAVSAYDAAGVSIVADFSSSVGTGAAPNLANLDPSSAGGAGFGGLYGAAATWSGYIRDLRYWPRRLSDNELRALVGI